MSQLIIPKNYKAALDLQQTEIAIKKIKDFFWVAFLQNYAYDASLRHFLFSKDWEWMMI